MIFDLTVADLINVIFIAAGLGICGMSIMHVGSGVHIRKEVKVYFQLFFTLINTYISIRILHCRYPRSDFYRIPRVGIHDLYAVAPDTLYCESGKVR